MRSLIFLLALLSATNVPARVRSVASRIDNARRILIITAHPDDEILLAPLLADRCVRAGASCAFVVMTMGEAGGEGSVRAGEMARAAAMFHARLTQWSFPDVMTDVDATWSNGDHPALVHLLADVIALEHPDMILTFDPAHGSTGHPAHRAIGALVLETGARNVYLLETAARFIGSSFDLSNAAPDKAWVIFANEDWEYVVRDAETHASQFTPEQVESLRTLPLDERRVWLLPAP
jgi:LmbE family N-acetylglucosaminyl deacetylase